MHTGSQSVKDIFVHKIFFHKQEEEEILRIIYLVMFVCTTMVRERQTIVGLWLSLKLPVLYRLYRIYTFVVKWATTHVTKFISIKYSVIFRIVVYLNLGYPL